MNGFAMFCVFFAGVFFGILLAALAQGNRRDGDE